MVLQKFLEVNRKIFFFVWKIDISMQNMHKYPFYGVLISLLEFKYVTKGQNDPNF